jgi:hypothetical protein
VRLTEQELTDMLAYRAAAFNGDREAWAKETAAWIMRVEDQKRG